MTIKYPPGSQAMAAGKKRRKGKTKTPGGPKPPGLKAPTKPTRGSKGSGTRSLMPVGGMKPGKPTKTKTPPKPTATSGMKVGGKPTKPRKK